MAIVGLSESEQEAILQTVACVLHLGNVVFYNNDRDEAVPVDDNAASALRNVSLLLQVRLVMLHMRIVHDSNF